MTTDRQNKIINLSAQIMQESPDERAFQHVVLCHLGFPRSKTGVRTLDRSSGTAWLRLDAGAIWNGNELIEQPLPYGAIPRLTMIASVSSHK